MKTKADWLAWFLQLLAGLFVGAVVGQFLIARRYRASFLNPQNTTSFIIGAALVGGALASHYGDKLWIGNNYRMLPPDAPEQSDMSNTCSLILGVTGVVLMIAAVVRNCGLV